MWFKKYKWHHLSILIPLFSVCLSLTIFCLSVSFFLSHLFSPLSLTSICLISESWWWSTYLGCNRRTMFFSCTIYNQEPTFKHGLDKGFKLFDSWLERSESHFWCNIKHDILPAEICPELNNFTLPTWKDISTEVDMQVHKTVLAQSKSSSVNILEPHVTAGGQLKWL